MDCYGEFYRFMLFALLCEGRGNAFFRAIRAVCGRRFACKYYFRRLFAGCDKATFDYLLSLYHDRYGVDLSGVILADMRSQILTGRVRVGRWRR